MEGVGGDGIHEFVEGLDAVEDSDFVVEFSEVGSDADASGGLGGDIEGMDLNCGASRDVGEEHDVDIKFLGM